MEKHTTVLIADNTEEFCNALSAALGRAEGFEILGIATDGEQTIRMVTERKPHILVLDMMLAKKDGISVLKAISSLQPRPVVLATSGFITEYVASAAANLGVQYPWLTVGIPAIPSLYFDWFGGCIQAFIFCTLTTLFIKQAAGE